jgi:hypothetical protein
LQVDYVPGGVVIDLVERFFSHTEHIREHVVEYLVHQVDLTTE